MTFYTPKGYVAGRDACVDEVMHQWQSRYCTFSDVSLCVSTFNVNGNSPYMQDLSPWFEDSNRADFYVIGLQEMDLQKMSHIVDDDRKEKEWKKTIKTVLPKDNPCEEICTVRLVGICLFVYKAKKSSVVLSRPHTNNVPTGIRIAGNSRFGNKGGVGCSIMFNDTTVAFINSHFAAGNGEVERRNQDFREISNMTFGNGMNVYDHDIVIWLGDLNYRINAENNGLSGDDIRRIASSDDFGKLLRYDQLREEQNLGRVLLGFNEPRDLLFRPTYKYDVGTHRWDTSDKGRTPAWCDRVLWWSKDNDTKIINTSYDSIHDITMSDHKPVVSTFAIGIKTINTQLSAKLYEEAIREADRRQNELLPQITLSSTEVDFGEVFYLKPSTLNVTINNTGKSTCRFNFKPRRVNEKTFCASWLQVQPQHYSLPVGKQVQITLTIVVEKRCSWEIEAEGKHNLSDILVLNLENGRDYFIPVTAVYHPRVFGVSLPYLLNRPPDNLIELDNDSGEQPEVPREANRLVSAILKMGLGLLDVNDFIDNHLFERIREALEADCPSDLTTLAEITAFSLYSTLIRFIDSLKDPLIPVEFRSNCYMFRADPSRMWSLIDAMPQANSKFIEFIVEFLRLLQCGCPLSASDQLCVWADILFRDASTASTVKTQAIQSLVSYNKDTALFHSNIIQR